MRLYLDRYVTNVVVITMIKDIVMIKIIVKVDTLIVILHIDISWQCASPISIVNVAMIYVILGETMVMLLPTIIIVVFLFTIIIITSSIKQSLSRHSTLYVPL